MPRTPPSHDGRAGCRIVILTDWLPPEFSAVSQYAIQIAREEAATGAQVVLVGTRSTASTDVSQVLGGGSLRIIGIRRPPVDRGHWIKRLAWTLTTNILLIARAWRDLRSCQLIRFSGSPPFALHVISVANLFLRKPLLYRITDFYPECIAAALTREPFPLKLSRLITYRLRRRVDLFEVIGLDMQERLLRCGVERRRIRLRRDQSPVVFSGDLRPLPLPEPLKGKKTLLYSGNWGVAHDVDTFVSGYAKHHREGSGTVNLWLNATGSGADEVARRLSEAGLPYYRHHLVPLSELAQLLITPDAHLITLRPAFVGFVLPSKVYACLGSARPIIYIGPPGSDIHLLCQQDIRAAYYRADNGDADAFASYLELI